jgi:hypothetical protein
MGETLFCCALSEPDYSGTGLNRREFLKAYTIISALIFGLLAMELMII